jgi:hypothetical protein
MAGDQAPGQAGGSPGEKAQQQGQLVVAGQRGQAVEQDETDDGQQQRPAPPALGQGDQRDGGEQRAQRIGRDPLPGHGLADVHAVGDLVEQAGRQGFAEDGDEAGQGQRQQPAQGQARG